MNMPSTLRSLVLVSMLGAGAAFAADAAKPADVAAKPAKTAKAAKGKQVLAPVKVVYHSNLGGDQAEDIVRNVGNHLDADPTAKIVVVGHAKGIQFMMKGAKDKNGNDFLTKIQDLALRNVEFRVCEKTLISGKLDPANVISEARIVPSGVAEIARLQAHEHYVYVKP